MIMSNSDNVRLLTSEEVAEELRMTVWGVDKLRYAGKLEYIRFGHRCIRFEQAAVERAISRLKVPERGGKN